MSRVEGNIFYVVCWIPISYWVPCRVLISHRPDDLSVTFYNIFKPGFHVTSLCPKTGDALADILINYR